MRLLRQFWAVVSHNLPWKLAALFASTALWVAINGSEPNADRYLRLTVRPFGLPKRLVIVDQDAWTLEVQIRGPRSILRTIDEEAHRIALDLGGVDAGSTSMKVSGDMLNLPRRVRVVRINPPRIEVQVERILRKELPVRVVLVPPRRNGYTISEPTVTPANVEVSGPSSRVERVQVIETEAINSLVDGHVERDVSFADAGELLSFNPETVRVAFAVSEVEGQRTFTEVAVLLQAAVPGSTLDPTSVELTVRGPQRRLVSLELADDTVSVDADGLGPGLHSITPNVDLPDDFRLDAVSPTVVKLRVPKPEQQDTETESGEATP